MLTHCWLENAVNIAQDSSC